MDNVAMHKAAPKPDTVTPVRLRAILGEYPTGVTIVTANNSAGQAVGVTVNSFASLSLQPALVSWALDLRSSNLDSFTRAKGFVVNLLSAEQKPLAERFARSKTERFENVPFTNNSLGIPLLTGSLACLECVPHQWLDAGDHRLFIGQVVNVSEPSGHALSFHRGQLHAYHGKALVAAPDELSFVDDYLAYLLARASQLVSSEFHAVVEQSGLSVSQWRVLATLSDSPALSAGALAERVLLKQPTLSKLLDRMQDEGLIKRRANPKDGRQAVVDISAKGKRRVASLLRQAKQHESDLLSRLGQAHVDGLKRELRTIISGYTVANHSDLN
jgi:flavin reductase (DIM6/NTAB) family NADH-FMN oxidoreductase RutF/DNA-binding MarR family transcriptional regulator